MASDEPVPRRGVIVSIPLDKLGLPDDAKIRAQSEANMREYGRRCAVADFERVMAIIMGSPVAADEPVVVG